MYIHIPKLFQTHLTVFQSLNQAMIFKFKLILMKWKGQFSPSVSSAAFAGVQSPSWGSISLDHAAKPKCDCIAAVLVILSWFPITLRANMEVLTLVHKTFHIRPAYPSIFISCCSPPHWLCSGHLAASWLLRLSRSILISSYLPLLGPLPGGSHPLLQCHQELPPHFR